MDQYNQDRIESVMADGWDLIIIDAIQRRLQVLEHESDQLHSGSYAELVEGDAEESLKNALMLLSTGIKDEIKQLSALVSLAKQASLECGDAKQEALLDLLEKIQRRDPGVKILLFTEFVATQDATLAFYQKSPCVGKVQSRQAVARFEDSRGEAISDEHRIIENSVSMENNERVTKITFHLLGSGYDRNADYWLVMKDAEDGGELARIAFNIDVVFGLDFEF